MANRHFAQIGDVWKHLPLGEILVLEAPPRYVETHAGSARYPLAPDWRREYGATHFLGHCAGSPPLAGSRYAALLGELAAPGRSEPLYPGSPHLALSLLAHAAREFLFFDLDPGSLDSIAECARLLGIPAERVHLVCGDGNAGVEGRVAELAPGERHDTFVFLDGYSPFEVTGGGPSCMEAFCRIVRLGVRATLWYGFHADSRPGHLGRTECREGIRRSLGEHGLAGSGSAAPWWAEIRLEAMGRPGFDLDPGVHGCGVLCANLQPAAFDRCGHLGEELARIYHGTRLPGGWSGALRFEAGRL